MKKIYIRPASETFRLETEGTLLSGSDLRIQKGEGTATGGEALTDRKTGMWDSDLWGTQE